MESELSELEVKMVDAVEMQNHSLISELKEKMESLEEEKKKLVLPEKDPFLEEEEELSDPFVEESEEL